MRQILMWTLILIVVFIVLLGVTFLALTMLTPTEEELQSVKTEADKVVEYKAEQSIQKQEELAKVVEVEKPSPDSVRVSRYDSLRTVIDSLNSEIFFRDIRSDSLEKALTTAEDQIQSLTSKNSNLQKRVEALELQQIDVKELAKTYETMKVNDIRPILEKVDDETVIALYKNMGSRTRKNLMQALSSVRAAQITKKIAGMSP